MIQAALQACPKCGRENGERALVCVLCSEVLHRRRAAPTRDDEPEERALGALAAPGPPATRTEPSVPRAEPWIYLGVGALTAPIFALTPLLGYMGWFLGSLVHEMGHSAIAWFFGMPAFPAISLEGHAAAVHSEPLLFVALAVWAGLFAAAWHGLEGRVRWVMVGVIALVYPALAFTQAKEVLQLLAGHGGELAFATLCLFKTLDGGFTQSRLERGLYGTVGWYLLGSNVRLCFGLITSESSRAWYQENGSFGLTNDMIRAAEDVLGWRLESVALLMLLVSLAVLPAALSLWRLSCRLRASWEAESTDSRG